MNYPLIERTFESHSLRGAYRTMAGRAKMQWYAIFCGISIFLIAALGMLFPPEGYPAILYIIPIAAAAWLFGTVGGCLAIVACMVAWIGSLLLNPSTPALSPLILGEMGLHIVVFLVLTSSIAMTRGHRADAAGSQPQHIDLSGAEKDDIIPICANCRKIRIGDGSWVSLESFLHERAELHVTHGICAECAEEVYREYQERKKERNKNGEQPGRG